MTDRQIFYRNVDVGDGEEFIVRANKGYGPIIEIVIESDMAEITIRLTASGAMALGRVVTEAADVVARS